MPIEQGSTVIQSDHRPSSIQRLALVIVALGVSLVLLALAVPRLGASVHFLPVDTAIQRYHDTGEIPSAQLSALERRARETAERRPHHRYFDGLSFISYLQARDAEEKPWLQRPGLYRAETAGLAALERAPARPRTWLRVARTRASLGREPSTVVSALNMSILTGRAEPNLLLPRLELGLRYLPVLDEEAVALLRDQSLLAWRLDPKAFRRAVEEGRIDRGRLRTVLGDGGETLLRDLEGGA